MGKGNFSDDFKRDAVAQATKRVCRTVDSSSRSSNSRNLV